MKMTALKKASDGVTKIQGLYFSIAENTASRRRDKPTTEDYVESLWEKVKQNANAMKHLKLIASDVANNYQNYTFQSTTKKRVTDFGVDSHCLTQKSSRGLFKECLEYVNADSPCTTVTPTRDLPESSGSESGDEEEPQHAEGASMATDGLDVNADEEDEERIEKTMQSDVLCMVEDSEATVNDALAIYPKLTHADEWNEILPQLPEEWQATIRALDSHEGASTTSTTSKRAAGRLAQRRLAMTTDIEPRDDGAMSVEESDEEDDDEEELSSASSRKRKKRRRSGTRKRRKGVSMEEQLIELHRKQLRADKQHVMSSHGFKEFVRLAAILFQHGNTPNAGERIKYTLLNFLMIFIDSYSNAREGVVDKKFVSSGYKLSKCTMGTEEKQHKQLRQCRRGYLKFSDRYQSDDDFVNFAFGERSTDDTLPLAYDRARLKSEYKSSASNAKPLFVIVKKMLKKKNDSHLLEGIKKVMQNSFKEEYLDGKYAIELLKIITDDDVVEFRSLLTTVLYYHYEDSEQFNDTVKHYHDVLNSNQGRLKHLFTILDTNLEQSRHKKGASLVVRGSVVRDNVNLLFTMFQGKRVMMPHAWKSLINIHLKKSRVERKQKVSPLTRDLFGHKMSFVRKEEGYTIADARWASKAFFDGIVTHSFYLMRPFVQNEVLQPIGELLGRYAYVDHNTKSAVTSKFYSPWITAFITAAKNEGLHFDDGIPDGRDKNGDFIQSGSDSDSEEEDGGELTMKNLGTLYMEYVDGIIRLCSIQDDQCKDNVDPVLFKKINESCQTILISFISRYTGVYDNKEWRKGLRSRLRSSLLEACRVKQGGSTKKKIQYMENPRSYMKSYSIAEHDEEEHERWNQMTQMKEHAPEPVDMEEEEDDL